MLPIKTCVKIFNLVNEPIISHVVIGEGYSTTPTMVDIYSNDNVDQTKFISLVKDIFPECQLSCETIVRDDESLWNRFTFTQIGQYRLSANHYEKEKAPAITQEPQENNSPDSTTEWTPEQILRNEG